MNHTREYKVSKIDNQYVLDILKDGYNIIEKSYYFDTREEAFNKAKEEMAKDMFS